MSESVQKSLPTTQNDFIARPASEPIGGGDERAEQMSESVKKSFPTTQKELNEYVESQVEELFANVQILNAIEFPIVRVNMDGTMRFANNAFLEASEVESDGASLYEKNDVFRDKICRMQFESFFAPEDLDEYQRLKEEAEVKYGRGAKNTFKIGATADLTFVSAKGNATPYRTNVTYSGKYAAYQVSLIDITDLKEAEQDLSLAYSEMEERVREQTEQIKEQAESILEMSTPVIKLWGGILLMPLIGTIDTQRAQQMSDEFLRVVGEGDIEVTILDVTGVPVIDTSVVRHLVDTVNAARILGAQTIITGFSPEIAQTIVNLGVDFSQLRTQGSLQSGVKEALRMRGIRVNERGK